MGDDLLRRKYNMLLWKYKGKLGKDYGGLIISNYTSYRGLVYKTYKEVLKTGHQKKKQPI